MLSSHHLSAAITAACLMGLSACGGAGSNETTPAAASTSPPSSDSSASRPASGKQTLYAAGNFASGWSADMSWNLCSPTAATLSGTQALLFDECSGAAWSAGGYLHGATAITGPTGLDFDIYLGASAATTVQQIGMAFGGASSGVSLASALPNPSSNAWNHVHVDLATPMNGLDFQDLMFMNSQGNPKFYVNNVVVASATPTAGGTPGAAISVAIDVKSNVHAISPLIYGVAAFENVASVIGGLNSPINRHGGNATTGYNWQIDAHAIGFDWYFETVPDGSGTAGGAISSLVGANKQSGADSMITIPMLGWVGKLGPNRSKLASFSASKYGYTPQPQNGMAGNDAQYMPDAGNGIKAIASNGTPTYVTGNDPNDAHVPADANFQKGLVQLLTQQFGSSNAGGVKYYVMDNEHSLWQSTHRDVHPQGAGMDEVYNDMVSYAAMVKSVDANAQIVGPEEWGWNGYFLSGKDQQAANWANPADKAAHGNMDYMPWLLQKLKQYETANGKRLLDVFSLHYYPQGGEYSNTVTTQMQLSRNKSTRSLWDASYVDATWINDKINLIPRMKAWVNQYYPGLKTAITEYSWGADDHINGATTQADVLGILGREGVDIATRWTAPAASSVTFKAMQMYRNYDGAKSVFGDQSVKASVPNPDVLSTFAALRSSDGALTVMVINKEASVSHPVALQLGNFTASGTARRWQLTKSNSIQGLSNLAYSGGQLTDTVPAQSITLYVIK